MKNRHDQIRMETLFLALPRVRQLLHVAVLVIFLSHVQAFPHPGLDSDSARERAFAVRDLGEQGGADVIAPLAAALGDGNVFVRAAAMQALHRLGEDEQAAAVTDALVNALKHENAWKRASAAETLGLLRVADAVTPLIALLEDSDPATQHASACALGHIGATQAVDALIGLVSNDDAPNFARMGAAWALGALKAAEAVEPLLAVALNARRGEWNYTSVTVYVVEALGKINDPASLPRLVAAFVIQDRHLHAQLALTLALMTGENFGQDAAKWKVYIESE